ncbi:hypothetical protein F4782DRAFT_535285 [Xylaria castorea]|nr:hypothetical protein F4782DRAFT_535285 [Xylaria castorea]
MWEGHADHVQDSLVPYPVTIAPQETQYQPRSGEFPCPECDMILSRRDALIRHARTAHRSGQHFWCQEDGCLEARKGYRRFHDFRKHMRLVHNKTVSADNIVSQQVLRGNHQTARDNEPRAMPLVIAQAVPQASPRPIAQPTSLATPQTIIQAIPRNIPQAIPDALGGTIYEQRQPNPEYVPDHTMYGGRPQPMFCKSDMLASLPVFPTFIPDHVRDGRRPEVTFKRSEMPHPPVNYNLATPYQARVERTVQPMVATVNNEAAKNHYMGYGDEERRRLIRTVESQASMYNELLHKYNKLQEQRDRLAFALQNVLSEELESQNGDPQN